MPDKVQILPTPSGIDLLLEPQGREPFRLSLPLQGAMQFWWDWWTALGVHFPKFGPDPSGPRPRMLELGDISYQVGSMSNGFVQVWLRPKEVAGFAMNFKPDEARDLARSLLAAADAIEQFKSPN